VSDALGVRAADTVASVRTDSPSYIDDEVEFTIALQGARAALSVAIEFTIETANFTAGEAYVEALNGFTALPARTGVGNVDWTDLGGGLFKGQITLAHLSGGLTSAERADILKISRVAGALGSASLTLTSVRVGEVGYDPAYSALNPAEAVNEIVKKYQTWDINHDEVVDQSDLNLVITYYRASSDDSDWDLKDRYGYKPSQADINGDGIVDLVDILEVFLHYTA
jgi:hypothetical protein